MRIAEIIGNVTLSKTHPALQSATWRIGVPCSLAALRKDKRGDGEPWVILDELGAGHGSLVAVSEGVEAAAPFFPIKKPVDAYCACILDDVQMGRIKS